MLMVYGHQVRGSKSVFNNESVELKGCSKVYFTFQLFRRHKVIAVNTIRLFSFNFDLLTCCEKS